MIQGKFMNFLEQHFSEIVTAIVGLAAAGFILKFTFQKKSINKNGNTTTNQNNNNVSGAQDVKFIGRDDNNNKR